jgi:hypothetical protein
MNAEPITDVVTSGQRIGAILIAIGMLLLGGFFVLHQTTQTGLLSDNFGTLEMLLLYVPILLTVLDFGVQIVTGRHHPARPFEAASALLMGLAAIWFLIRFPFDFTHLGDVLPEGLRFLLGWVTNDLAKIPLVIQVIAGPLGAFQAIRAFLAGPG